MSELSVDNVCESWEELVKDVSLNAKSSDEPNNLNIETKKSNDKLDGLKTNDEKSINLISNKNGRQAAKTSKGAVNNSTYSFKNVQIKFEDDNIRNHFITQIQQQQNTKVKILQRPKQKEEVKNDNGNNFIKNGFYNAKTIKEREAEYAKARLRILGPNYENESQTEPQKPINNQSNQKEDDLVRKPQGPNNLNFNQRR